MRYLAQPEDADLDEACPLPLLVPDLAGESRAARNAFAQCTAALLKRIADHFPEVPGMARRDSVIAVDSTCVGAVMLASAMRSSDTRRRILGVMELMLRSMLAPVGHATDREGPAGDATA